MTVRSLPVEGGPRGELATTRQIRGCQVHLPQCAEHTDYDSPSWQRYHLSADVDADSGFQNFGVTMPGWYDIVRRRDDVRNPTSHLSRHSFILVLLTWSFFSRQPSPICTIPQTRPASSAVGRHSPSSSPTKSPPASRPTVSSWAASRKAVPYRSSPGPLRRTSSAVSSASAATSSWSTRSKR